MAKNISYEKRKYGYVWTPIVLGIFFFVFILAMVYFNEYYYESQAGMEQPIPFSHRVHVTDKKVSCVMCHEGVFSSKEAGIPPLQTCMLCHEHIIRTFPPIKELRQHYYAGIPVEWKKVLDIPEFVYFSHSVHTSRGIDCGHCHGNVAGMDRIKDVNQIDMGFCFGCHREENAAIDCFTCHD